MHGVYGVYLRTIVYGMCLPSAPIDRDSLSSSGGSTNLEPLIVCEGALDRNNVRACGTLGGAGVGWAGGVL